MNLIDTMLSAYGLSADADATDETKSAMLIQHAQTIKVQLAATNTLMERLGAKTPEDAMAVLATMVPRTEMAPLEEKIKSQDVTLVLLEGQMQGKLTMADCEPGKGWAHNAAVQSPTVLRGMLPNLPVKVATGTAIKSFVSELQTKTHEDGPKTVAIGAGKYALTEMTANYDANEIENLMDLAATHGVEKLIKQGYLKAV
jgi:hypothetical protein